MIELVWPWALVALPLPLLVRWLAAPISVQHDALTVPSIDAYRVTARVGAAAKPKRWRLILMSVGWIALVLAATRPQWSGEPVALPTSGRDLMLAVDISGSMSTEDMELEGTLVNRLAVVKDVVNDFIERRQGDRIGLILFGTNAYLQTPLTFDLKTVRQLLAEAPVGIAGGKTAIGDAVGLAVKRLRSRPAESRVLVLLTDGANNVGEVSPSKAAELAAREGIRIHTIGVGNDELRVPSLFGSRIVNPAADLDEQTLRAVAASTGGNYYRARDTVGLIEIYQEIDALEPIDQEAEQYRPIRALYHLPTIAALIAFAVVLVARSRRD